MVVAACGIFTCSMQDLVPWLRVNPGPLRWECSLSHWATREVLRNSWKQPSSLCCCCCSVAQASLTLCDPTDCSPLRLLCPGDFPGKNIGVGCHFLLQGIFLTQRLNLNLPHCRQILYYLSQQGSSQFSLLICKFNAIPMKISLEFFLVEFDKSNSKIYMKEYQNTKNIRRETRWVELLYQISSLIIKLE